MVKILPMEMMISNFLVIVILNLGSAEYVEVLANTFTRIINRNYTEYIVSVSSKMECAMLCLNTNFCEAIYHDRSTDDSRCLLGKYITSTLYPLIIDTSLPSNTSWMFLIKHEDYCVTPPGYQFEPDLLFWYKLVLVPTLNATDAQTACGQDKAYLLLIDNDSQFNFTQNLLDENNLSAAYIQGVRTTKNDPFLDESGRVMTYSNNWGNGGVGGPGNYMRFGESWIETSRGDAKRAYICQLRLN